MNYAILIIGALLSLKKFDHEDEWKIAMQALSAKNRTFLAFKWHHGAQAWQQVEVVQ